jgi:UDP-N-acetylglucosamine 1-carboxyvinyltransferase
MLYKPKLLIKGGKKLKGEIKIQGAKNSLLPIAAGAMLCGKGETVLLNSPDISDTYVVSGIINELCGKALFQDNILKIKTENCKTDISDENCRKVRSSIIFAGALLGRNKECVISMPGGDCIGNRPINHHLEAFERMGVKKLDAMGRIYLVAENGLKGAKIPLIFPSVGVTENVILAACLADGETIITNAAREPEITDLVAFLTAAGAKIRIESGGRIVINGVPKLQSCTHRVMPDRIAAATILAGCAATGGIVTVKNCNPFDMEAILPIFEYMGANVYQGKDSVTLSSGRKLRALPEKLTTMVYPGFPTDAQSVIMGALCKTGGTSVIEETIFENRYRHVPEMQKMGADIVVSGQTAIIKGVKKLHGARIKATDLRGGAGLVICAMTAEGRTEIEDIRYIDRGYECLEDVFAALGADIKRI